MDGTHGNEMNTVWAMLFLVKSTAKIAQATCAAEALGAGTLLGGRELPKDLNSMTVAGGRVVSRPMNGAIEGMLAVLEDPRAEQADAAVAGLVDRYYREGPTVLRPYKMRFRKMLDDRDPGLRRVAAWALAHTGDLDVVPRLIEVIARPNEDEDVIGAARLGLQLLSRKIDGLGPPSPSTPEERLRGRGALARLVPRNSSAGRRRRRRRSPSDQGWGSDCRPFLAAAVADAAREFNAMTQLAAQMPSQAVEAKPGEEPELEAKVLGESRYDQVTSFLMAVVMGAIMVVGWLALVYVSNQAYASRVTAPLTDHPGLRRRRRQSRRNAGLDRKGRRRRGRRRARWPPTTKRLQATSKSPRSNRRRPRCSTRSPRPARAWRRST